jgi:DNA uptake protein ComE-like DNA-binding protein
MKGATSIHRASVLVVVLWTSLGLVSVALMFGHSMLMTYRGTDNEISGRQADEAIEGVSKYVQTLLINGATPGEIPDLTLYETEGVSVGEAKFWLLGRLSDPGNGQTRSYGLIDEASKLNINTATVGMLRELPWMTDEFAAAIVDWRDEDEEITSNGAESETYATKQPAYACKNAPFESIEELALVHGATSELLYGEDANLNGVLDPNEDDGNKSDPPDNSDGKLDPGILEYVTVFSTEPTTRSDGETQRVNLTQRDQLTQMLADTLGQERADAIIGTLPPTPLTSPLDFYVTSSTGANGITTDEFDQIAGNLVTNAQAGATGSAPVNVNTASETVLMCIPGLRDIASSIVATRLTRTQPSTGLAWAAEAIGDQAIIRQAGPFLTGRTWQVMADVAAVGRYGRGYRRTKFIIDNSSGTPKIIYRRSLSALGWALGSDVRQDLVLRKERR